MPTNHEKHAIFYGWWIVVAAFLIGMYSAGVVTYGFTAIFEPIASDTGWSYTQISIAVSLRGLEASFLAPVAGAFADRWGSRKIIFGAIVIIIIGLLLLSHATSLLIFYSAFILMAAGINGCTQTVPMTAIAQWFRQKVGLASGIASSGPGFSGLIVLVMVQLIEIFGWRSAINILALVMLVIVLPISLLFRHKPEQYGYVPDGRPDIKAISENGVGTSHVFKPDVNVRQALKSSIFWRITLALLCTCIVIFSLITHVMPHLSSIGVSRSTAGVVAMAIPITSVIGRLTIGWLGDKLDRRWLAAGSSFLVAIGLLWFDFASTADIWMLIPFLIFLGIGYGGYVPLIPSLVKQYFGTAYFGSIYGFVTGIAMLGGVLGPPLAGWVYDMRGNYQGIWLAMAGLSIVAIMSMITIPRVK